MVFLFSCCFVWIKYPRCFRFPVGSLWVPETCCMHWSSPVYEGWSVCGAVPTEVLNQPPRILRDNLSLQGVKVICIFFDCMPLAPQSPLLFKGQPHYQGKFIRSLFAHSGRAQAKNTQGLAAYGKKASGDGTEEIDNGTREGPC